jgi:hypothetical protein
VKVHTCCAVSQVFPRTRVPVATVCVHVTAARDRFEGTGAGRRIAAVRGAELGIVADDGRCPRMRRCSRRRSRAVARIAVVHCALLLQQSGSHLLVAARPSAVRRRATIGRAHAPSSPARSHGRQAAVASHRSRSRCSIGRRRRSRLGRAGRLHVSFNAAVVVVARVGIEDVDTTSRSRHMMVVQGLPSSQSGAPRGTHPAGRGHPPCRHRRRRRPASGLVTPTLSRPALHARDVALIGAVHMRPDRRRCTPL